MDNVKKYIKIISERFPETGVEVYSTDGVGILQGNPYVTRHLVKENLSKCDPDIFGGSPLCKVEDARGFFARRNHKYWCRLKRRWVRLGKPLQCMELPL
jgi:hypothetical protein